MSQPDFLGIGVQKGGTTWLHRALMQHPDAWMPSVKELHYYTTFNNEKLRGRYRAKFQNRSEIIVEKFHSKGWRNTKILEMAEGLLFEPMLSEEWYAKQFEIGRHFAGCVGEITPGYWAMDQNAFQQLREKLTATKFILTVRDPIDRAMSAVRMYGTATEIDYTAAEKFTGENSIQSGILHHSSYSRFLPRWIDSFQDGRLLVLPFKRIHREPEKVMEEVEDFLGLAKAPYKRLAEPRNQSAKVAIHPDTLPFLEKHLAAERDYLRQTFGDSFMDDI